MDIEWLRTVVLPSPVVSVHESSHYHSTNYMFIICKYFLLFPTNEVCVHAPFRQIQNARSGEDAARH
jgi:hypothetical protein